MPTSFALVEQAFAFLPTTYGCVLQAQHVDRIESIRDLRATIIYVGEKIEVDLIWGIAAMTIRAWFVEVLIPRVSPPERAIQEGRQGTRQIGLHTLAELLGHADDPYFVLVVAPVGDGRDFNRNYKRLQADFP
jgi:hypothetical protein